MRPTEQCVSADQAQIRRHVRRETASPTLRHALLLKKGTMPVLGTATSRGAMGIDSQQFMAGDTQALQSLGQAGALQIRHQWSLSWLSFGCTSGDALQDKFAASTMPLHYLKAVPDRAAPVPDLTRGSVDQCLT